MGKKLKGERKKKGLTRRLRKNAEKENFFNLIETTKKETIEKGDGKRKKTNKNEKWIEQKMERKIMIFIESGFC